MSFVLELCALLLGLLFGSFLNVCISRMPDHRSVIQPRSHCPICEHAIRWYDNVPVLSWLLLRGRCRDCGAAISWRYPAVELAVGLIFAYAISLPLHVAHTTPDATTAIVKMSLTAVGVASVGFCLIGLMVTDWQTHRLPDGLTLSGMGIGFLLVCVQAAFLGPHEDEVVLHGANPLTSVGSTIDRGNVVLTGPEHMVLARLGAMAAVALILLAIRAIYQALRHREGIGLGDVKLLAMMAAFVGFGDTMLTLLLGSVLCSVYALFLVARGRASATTRLPFGTFLAIAGLMAVVFGTSVMTWYQSLL